MGEWNLKITLKSDLCTATGEYAPGITNVKTAMEHGVPYLPAKRVKGCLLNTGMEMRDNGLVEQETLWKLFGKAGGEKGQGVHIGDARLCFIPPELFGTEEGWEIAEGDYEQFHKEVQSCLATEQTYLEKFFTRYRTRTAMENGTASKHSLRTMQVVPAKVVFVSRIDGVLSEKEEEVLQWCAKGLRHMGLGITRGFGEVRCELERVTSGQNVKGAVQENAYLLQNYLQEDEVVLRYEIDINAPVVIGAGERGECLPAEQVMGALAGMYIKKFSLGANAHKDEDFSRIFLRDGVLFGYNFLKMNNKEYIPCPKAIAKIKEERSKWFNIGDSSNDLRRKAIHGSIYWENQKLHLATVREEIHFHHARPVNRGIGHALNDRAIDTSVPTGEFFQYIARSKNQTYAGTWVGKAKDIGKLLECLRDNSYRLRLGKSKTAEYGDCTFRIKEVRLKSSQSDMSARGEKWMLWLMTPMICRDRISGGYALDEKVLKAELEEVLGCRVKRLDKIACSYMTYGGYNSRWRLPSAACPALAAGCTFLLETDREISASELESHRWGENVGRGCGQIAARLWDTTIKGEIVMDPEEEQYAEIKKDGLLAMILSSQKKKFVYEKAVISALDKVKSDELPPSSAISMLIQLLKIYPGEKDFYSKMLEKVKWIRKDDKRGRIIRLIEPCKDESYEFMKLYLENAKWKARCRNRDEC